MDNVEASSPVRKIRHFIFTWCIKAVFMSKKELQNGTPILSKELRVDPVDESAGTWQLGMSKMGDKLIFYIVLKNGPPKLFVKMNVSIKLPNFHKDYSAKYRRWFKREKKLQFSLDLTWPDFVKFLGEKHKSKLYTIWSVVVDVLYHQNQDVANEPISQVYGYYLNVGTDLSKFCMNTKYSDKILQLKSREMPIHMAVVDSRYPLLLDRFSNFEGHVLPGWNFGSDALFYFLLFVYCGNIETLIDVGVLPIGLFELTRELGAADLCAFVKPEILVSSTTFNCPLLQLWKMIPLPEDCIGKHIWLSPILYHRLDESLFQCYIRKSHGRNVPSSEFMYAGVKILEGTQPVKCFLDVAVFTRQNRLFYKRSGFLEALPQKSAQFCVLALSRILKKRSEFDSTGFKLTVSIFNPSNYTMEDVYTRNMYRFRTVTTYPTTANHCIHKLNRDFESMMNNTQPHVPRDLNLKLRIFTSSGENFPPQLEEYAIDVHKVMVAARSPKLSEKLEKSLLSERLEQALLKIEASELLRKLKYAKRSTLLINNIAEFQLSALVSEIYTGYPDLNQDNVTYLYEVAWAFGLSNLKHRCDVKLRVTEWLTRANYETVLSCARMYGDVEMQTRIKKNF